MPVVRVLPILLALFAACSKPASTPAPPAPSAKLEPLPPPPKLDIEKEALAGAGAALAVVVARPTGQITADARPTLTFSKPIVALGEPGPAPATITPAVAGEWKWLGSTTAEFVPAASLPLSTRFTVEVPAGLVSVDGSTLSEPYSWSFETPAPAVVAITPNAGYAWVKPGEEFTLTMNQRVSQLPRHVWFDAGGRRVEAVVSSESRFDVKKNSPPYWLSPEELDALARQYVYVVTPAGALPRNANVALVIDASLSGTEGPSTLGAEKRFSYRTFGPMKFESASVCAGDPTPSFGCSRAPLVIQATNPISLKSLETHLRLEPPAEINWADSYIAEPTNTESQRAFVAGNFKPGVRYTVRVAAGATDVFDQKASGFETEVRIPDLPPLLQAGAAMALVEAAGDGTLPIQTVNLQSFSSRLHELTPAETATLVLRWVGDSDDPIPQSLPVVEATHALDAPKNSRETTRLDLRSALSNGAKTGLVFVEVRGPGASSGEPSVSRVLAQVTDLAVHAKVGATQGIAWITRLSTGAPVEGARVTMRDVTGNIVGNWTGKTDADGLVQLPQLPKAMLNALTSSWERPEVVVFAESEGDIGFASGAWSHTLSPWSFDLLSGWALSQPSSVGVVFTERGIYRPGDEVFVRGVVRSLSLGKLSTPKQGTPVAVTVRDANGDTLIERTVKTSAFGGFDLKLGIKPDVALGEAYIEARVGTMPEELYGYFKIAEYRAPRFQVDVETSKDAIVAGDALEATVSGRYLFGAPMAGAEVRWSTIRANVEDFAPRAGAGFTFGPNVWANDDGQPDGQRSVGASGAGVLDAAGRLRLEVEDSELSNGRAWRYTVEATVADVDRQRVTGRHEYVVHPASHYAGVRKKGEGFASAGKPASIEAIALDVGGAVAANVALDLVVRRREWKSIRQKGFAGHWTTTSEAVDEEVHRCKLTSETNPVACTFTPKEPGFHIVEATTTDAKNRTQKTTMGFYVTGSRWAAWQRNDSDRIDLVADKPRYEVGDTAKILVKSPWPKAEAVVTLEREGVRWAKRMVLDGAAEPLAIPIDEEMVPNAFVGVVLFRGRVDEGAPSDPTDADPGRPVIGYGYVELKVEKSVKRLQVDVTADKPEARPGDKLRLSLDVKDSKGRGRKAEVTVWMVDEGVLRLTNYKKPELLDALVPVRSLSTEAADSVLHLVARVNYTDKGETDGGGGGDEGHTGIRSRFQTTAYFNPSVVTDAEGRATVDVQLPDNLTTYRVMAVAVTELDEAGGGESSVTVSKPLLALPALPRLARAGDEFEAGVVIHSKGRTFEDVVVTATVEGLEVRGERSRTVNISSGRPEEVRFRFHATQPGTARLRFSVEGDGERDAVEQSLPVALPVSFEAVATYGETEAKQSEALKTPGGIRADAGGLTLTLSSSVLGGYDEAMRQLVEYPYGCAEQLSSRLVPFIALRELHGKYEGAGGMRMASARIRSFIGDDALQTQGSTDPDEVVRRTVTQLSSMQMPRGGFRYWSTSRCEDAWTSAYATLALSRAAELGYPVPEGVVAKARDFLATGIAAGKPVGCAFAPADDVERVFALYVLARTGSPKASFYDELFERREALPLFAKALLADAMFVGQGDRGQAKALLAEVLNHAKESPGEVHFEESQPSRWAALFSSDARTTAIVLQTLVNVTPEHPFVPKLARYLGGARQKDGRYRSTQESAFSLMALAELARTKEARAPDFEATVALGSKTLAQAAFKGPTLGVERIDAPIEALDPGKKLSLTFSKKGQGTLTYGALLRYAPKDLPTTPLDQGLVVQRWFEPFAGGGQARKFQAGELIRVRVRVASHMRRRYVAVSVPLPAGLEALDTTLATTATIEEDEGDESLTFFSPFNHSEMRDDRVTYFANELPPGIHVASFVARATTPGDYVLMPASAEEMYAPEVNGRSDGGRFVVSMPTQVSER